jgi:glutamate-1-semialdehyde 2,1-aminomutase
MSNKVTFNNNYPVITKSENLIKRAKPLIPALTQTLAKGPTQWIDGVAPKYLKKGKGSHVWDVDGNEYIDYNMGIGPIVLGYAYDKVDDAIREQLKDGITFSLMHPLEVQAAEKIRSVILNAENIRFSKTGCDATSAAVRLARAYTKRNKILCCGYHGWHDWYITITDRNAGIPDFTNELTNTFDYNDINSLIDSIDYDTACVILEPAIFEKPTNDFLFNIQVICKRFGAVLIFDEMWTGFRMAVGGAQEYFGIFPDLAVYSKAIANGMPISVLTGKEEIMRLLNKDVFFFTTFGGEALSLAAVVATIDEIIEKNVPEHLFKQGKKLREGYNQIAEFLDMDYTKCIGYDVRTIVTFNPAVANPLEMKSLVQQEMIKHGILWGGFHNICFSHSDEDINYTLSAYEDILPILKKAVAEKNIKKYLKGNTIEPVFRKTTNFKQTEKV